MLLQKKAVGICIAASTLPIAFLSNQIEILNIKKILVTSDSLACSYDYINHQRSKKVLIEVLPQQKLFQIFIIFYYLLSLKIKGQRVIFFHECCLPIFDILIQLIRPNGDYFPQVTMSGYEQIYSHMVPRDVKGIVLRLIDFFGISKLFTYYRSPAISGIDPQYITSMNVYPAGIAKHSLSFSRDVVESNLTKRVALKNSLLFIVAKHYVPDAVQIQIFNTIIQFAQTLGYSCSVKDHPNPANRLNLICPNVENLDPLYPVELLPHNYTYAIGVGSTGLLYFPKNSLSLINLIPGLSAEDKKLSVDHLLSIVAASEIIFILDEEHLKALLKERLT